MLTAGRYHILKVNRVSDHGLYLADGEGEEVLLPNRYVSLADRVGDEKEVFIYHDSENRLIATTERPFAIAGEAACLEVVDKNIHGAFLDWGITAKDLFIPNSNQVLRMDAGGRYVVFVYCDNVSGRVVATTRMNNFISNVEITVCPREEVVILVSQKLPMGYRVIINSRHWGMVYDNQLFRKIAIGERLKGYIRRITEDNRIDVSLQKEGFNEVMDSADRLLELVWQNGGRLPLSDDSTPEEIAAATQMSKKVFKRSLGYLLSRKQVRVEGGSIVLEKQPVAEKV